MFFRKRPGLQYAADFFDQLIHLVTTSAKATENDKYNILVCVLAFYIHALRYARCTDEEMKPIIRSVVGLLKGRFKVDEWRIAADMTGAFNALERNGDFYIAAAEAYYVDLAGKLIDKLGFVQAVTMACDHICADFISKGFIKPDGSVAFLRFHRGPLGGPPNYSN